MLQSDAHCDSLTGQVAGKLPATSLRSVKIKIISNCNLRCEMCRYWQIAKARLEPDVVFSVLDHAAALGSKKVHFSGGEVTLHPDTPRFIEHATQLGMRVNLTSNGIALDREKAKQWIAAGLRAASFSIDGTDARTHDKIRGVEGAFKKTCKAVRILKREIGRRPKTKLKIRINTVVSQQNFEQLPALIELAGQLGALDVVPMPVDGDRVIRPTVKEIRFYNEQIAPQVLEARNRWGMPINSSRIYPFGRTKKELEMSTLGQYAQGYYENKPCYAPWLHAFVSHDGRVFVCCMTRQRIDSLGNVNRRTLTEIFQGERYERLRRQMLEDRLPICGHCDQFTSENRLVENRINGKSSLFQLT